MLRSVSAVVFIQNLQNQFEGFSFADFWVGPGLSRGRTRGRARSQDLAIENPEDFAGVGRGRTQFTVEPLVLAMSDQNPSKVRELIAIAMH